MLVSVPLRVATKRRPLPLEEFRREEKYRLYDGGLEKQQDGGLDGRKEGNMLAV